MLVPTSMAAAEARCCTNANLAGLAGSGVGLPGAGVITWIVGGVSLSAMQCVHTKSCETGGNGIAITFSVECLGRNAGSGGSVLHECEVCGLGRRRGVATVDGGDHLDVGQRVAGALTHHAGHASVCVCVVSVNRKWKFSVLTGHCFIDLRATQSRYIFLITMRR